MKVQLNLASLILFVIVTKGLEYFAQQVGVSFNPAYIVLYGAGWQFLWPILIMRRE